MNHAIHQPSLPSKLSENLILIAFACSLIIHLAVAAFKFDWSSVVKEKPKPITVELIKIPAPVVAPPTPVKPKPVVKPKKKPKPKPKPKKKVIKKRKPVIKKVVKPALVPTPSPVVVPEPVYEPLPAVAPTPEPVIEPIPEPVVTAPEPTPVVEALPSVPAGPTASDIEAAQEKYRRLINDLVKRYKKYPRIAKSRGWQGTTIIEFKLDPSGNVISKQVVQSSGHGSLDKAALKMADKAAPFPKLPAILKNKNYTFQLKIPFKLQER